MAVDKLVDSTQLDADLTSVANAIRTKGGTSAALAFPADFVSAIAAIETGGGGYSLDDIATHNFTGAGEITITNAELPQYVFAKSKFTSFSAPNFKDKDLPAHWLRESKLLQTVSLPVHNKSLGNYSFYGCSSLTSVSAPKATVLGGYNFSGCTALPLICFPSLANNSATGTDIINNCTSLTTVDLGPITRVDANAFRNAPAFNTLILRRTGTPTTLNNISAFTNTPFASGGSGGTLYVPSALVNQYTQATNWSIILGYANNQILSIEGSIYETQYADGTPVT